MAQPPCVEAERKRSRATVHQRRPEATARSEQGVEVAKHLGEILEKARPVDSLVAQVSTASSEQSHGIEQINSAVNQLDKVTQSNAASAKETASASGELNAQSVELHAAADQLAALVGLRTSGSAAPARPGLRQPASPKKTSRSSADDRGKNQTPRDRRTESSAVFIFGPRPALLVVRRPKHRRKRGEEQRRSDHDPGIDRHMIMWDGPRHDEALRHDHQPRHAEKPALEARQPGERMEVKVHAANLLLPGATRSAAVGRACARVAAVWCRTGRWPVEPGPRPGLHLRRLL